MRPDSGIVRSLRQGSSEVLDRRHDVNACGPRRALPTRPGKLSRRTGQREQANEHLTTATTMYRDMGMTYWLEKAEAEMRGLAG